MTENRRKLAEKLYQLRHGEAQPYPMQSEIEQFARECLGVLFPHGYTEGPSSVERVLSGVDHLETSLRKILRPLNDQFDGTIDDIIEDFIQCLPNLQEKLHLDVVAHYEGDPACISHDEVLLAYPGFFAVAIYRIAHEFSKAKIPLFPRMLSEFAHRETGIDIHPGAQIDDSFAIDHGTGIVIGETSVIGKNVKMYQGATLGGVSIKKELADQKRHPTIEDNVVIYANATILGGDTVIGHHSVIGGSVWLTESVLPYSVVYHKSEIKLKNTNNFEI